MNKGRFQKLVSLALEQNPAPCAVTVIAVIADLKCFGSMSIRVYRNTVSEVFTSLSRCNDLTFCGFLSQDIGVPYLKVCLNIGSIFITVT